MRAPLWETSVGALAALLNSKAPFTKADLYTLKLASGAVYRWSGSDVAVVNGSYTWSVGPGLQRTAAKFVVGTEVDTLTVTVTDNVGTTISGQALIPFIRGGGLQGARVQVDRVFWGASDTAPVGALQWFSGRVSDLEMDRYSARVKVASDLELLNTMVPRDVYQASCLNTLYDAGCGKLKSAYTVSSTASGATDSKRITFSHSLGQSTGYFDLGVVSFTSGANAGISRSVRSHISGSPGALTVLQPWPYAVASGDVFTIYPGCDKTQSTCSAKYSNLGRFRGMPYIPVPDTIL